MKKKILSVCTLVSASLFVVFAGLYIYILVAAPDSGIHWPNITIKHSNPTTVTNYPSKTTSVDNPSVHISVTKDWGGNVVIFNQDGPCVGAMVISMSNDHSTTETGWVYFGIFYRLITDTHRPDNWWTLMISLWYPIILFGILPAIFVVKKLCGRKSASTKKTPVEK